MRASRYILFSLLGVAIGATTLSPSAKPEPAAPFAVPVMTKAASAADCHLPKLAELAGPGEGLELLLATTPDPRVPRHRRYYDHAVSAIDSGMLEGGYVLERFNFPWQEALAGHAAGADDGCYGWMLFRQDRWRDGTRALGHDELGEGGSGLCEHEICRRLLLLVPETASQGVARAPLDAALATVAATLDEGRGRRLAPYRGCELESSGRPPVLLFGPWFSGSVDSLVRAAQAPSGQSPPGLCAVSPSATASSNAVIASRPGAAAPRFRLISLAVSDNERMRLLATLALGGLHLGDGPADRAQVETCEQTGKAVRACRNGDRVAFITESSVFGKDVCPDRGTSQYEALDLHHRMLCAQSLQLSFPANIAELRHDADAAAAKARSRAPVLLPLAGSRLSLDDAADDGSEFPESVQSRSTSISAELQLDAALDRLGRSDARIVVVVATDVRDRIYLFQQVRARLPAAMLVDFTGDRLLAHPEAVASSRGALVLASSELSCAQTDERYCWNVGEQPGQLLFRGQSLRISAWPTDSHALLAKAISRIGRPSSGRCPRFGNPDGDCATRPPLAHVVTFNGLYSLAGRGRDLNLALRVVPGFVVGLLALLVAAMWLLHHDAAMQALGRRRDSDGDEAEPRPVEVAAPWLRRALLPALPVLTFAMFFEALDYTVNAMVIVGALVLSYGFERQAGVSARIWAALRNDPARRDDGGHRGHWGGVACVILFVLMIGLLLIGEAVWWSSASGLARQLAFDSRSLRALAMDSSTGMAWCVAVVLVQVTLAGASALLLTGLAANARNARLLPNEAPLRRLYERFLDWRDPVIALVALPSLAVALIVGFSGLQRTIFGDFASGVILAGLTASTIAGMVLLAAQFNLARRLLRLSAYVGHRFALNLGDEAAAEVPGLWKATDPHYPLRFPATPVVALVQNEGRVYEDFLGITRLAAWRQQICDDLGSHPAQLVSRMPLYLLFASELTIFRGAAFAAALVALASVLVVYLFPVTASASFIGINVAVLAAAGLLSGLMAVQFERDPVLSNIVCNRSRETRFSSALFAYIAFPFVVLAAAIAIAGIPGMLDWGGGLLGWVLNKLGAGL